MPAEASAEVVEEAEPVEPVPGPEILSAPDPRRGRAGASDPSRGSSGAAELDGRVAATVASS